MKRGYYIIIIGVVIILAVAYFIMRFSILKTDHPKPDISKSESIIDLRPLMIAKFQQLVKQGSDGLYNLSIEKLEPDILQSTVNVFNVTLTPDSAALKKLDSLKKAPDDIFKLSFKTLHITGINADDLLHSDKIDLDSIFIVDPVFEVYHDPKQYNQLLKERENSATLYKKLSGTLKHLGINAITEKNGTFIHKNIQQKNQTQKFNDVSIRMSDLLFDSLTQFDKNRFLFSKQAELSCKNYLARTPDSLYFFRAGSISIDATKHTMIGKQVALAPRGNKNEFKKRLAFVDNRFDIKFPVVVFSNVDWWAVLNNEYFSSEKADIYNGEVNDYIDRSLPADPNPATDNFPHQLLMQIPLKVNVARLNLHHLNVIYEEYDAKIEKAGKVYFDNINAVMENITNVPTSIKKNRQAVFSGSGLFMHRVPITGKFRFDLAKYKTGNFSGEFHIGEMDKTILNPFTEPLGRFSVNSGTLEQASAHIEGNNFTTKATLLMLYNDLHLSPLKKDNNNPGSLKKKTFTSFIANTFLIKNNNPSPGGVPRKPEVTVPRDHHDNFFNFVWKTILVAILKTIGIPEKFANK